MQKTFLLLITFLLALSSLQAQDAKDDMGWTFGGGLGLDLAGMGIKNPRVGGGTNRFGLGGLGSVFVNNKSEKSFWNNQVSLQLSTQKIGRTALNQPDGFQKSLDVLRLTSTYGYKVAGEKLYVSADLLAQTQLLKTYKSNYLSALDSSDIVVSNFFSPLLVQFSPGLTYKTNDHLSFQYSPVALRYILVKDDALAALQIHGNEAGKNTFLGMGSELVGRYNNKFYGDRITMSSTLRLFSNYLKEPQNIDVLFANNFSIQIFKGLSLDLLGEVFYDQDVKMNIDANDNNVYGDPGDRQAPATQLTGAFLLKYNKIF